MPIERRIREGAERNAAVLHPDIDRLLNAVVRKAHRRAIVRRSLTAAASLAAVVVAIVLGPSVLDGIRGTAGTAPGSDSTLTVAPSVAPTVPLLTGMFTRTIPEGTAVVRANGIAGRWTISAGAGNEVRILAPVSFGGSHASHAFELQAGSLRTDAFSSSVCSRLAAGTYRWTLAGGYLVLTPISDPCDARVVVLAAGPWKIRP